MRKLLSFYGFQYDFAREVTRKFPIFLHIVIQERQILSVVNPLPVSVSENDVLCLNCNQMCSISIPHIIQWPFSSSHID